MAYMGGPVAWVPGDEQPPSRPVPQVRALTAAQRRDLNRDTQQVLSAFNQGAEEQVQHDRSDAKSADTGASHLIRGDQFVLETPDVPEAVWGTESEVAWACGEAATIVADSGVGKTTLAGLLCHALVGLSSEVLGLPVVPAKGRVLYLAMDRPRQAARSLRRQFGPEHAAVLAERLVVWPGPPLEDMAKDASSIVKLAELAGASHVIIDSLKDATVGLTDDTVGAGYNRTRQTALAAGIELLELHHNRKAQANSTRSVTSLSDVYGSVWLTSGAGSVIALNGEVGGSVIDLRHLKQPASDIGPLKITVDRAAGSMTTTAATEVLDCLRDAWVTPRQVAILFEQTASPSRAAIERVRRRLDQLVEQGQAETGSPVMASNHKPAMRYRRRAVEALHEELHGAARELFEDVR